MVPYSFINCISFKCFLLHNFRTLKSNITCKEEHPDAVMPARPAKIINPIVDSGDTTSSKYNVTAKGFFSTYTQKIEQGVLDGAKSLVSEVNKIMQTKKGIRNFFQLLQK